MCVFWCEGTEDVSSDPPKMKKPQLSDFDSGKRKKSRKKMKRTIPPLVEALQRKIDPAEKTDELHRRTRKTPQPKPSVSDGEEDEDSELGGGIPFKTTVFKKLKIHYGNN